MTDKTDAQLIANALKFLASGFEMAAQSEMEGSLQRIDGGTDKSHFGDRVPKPIRVGCDSGHLRLGRFRTTLPIDFLLDSIGRGTSRMSLSEEAGRVYRLSGMSARDGSESYFLRQVDLIYSDIPDGFAIEVTMQLGEPVSETFICTAAVDRAGETYRATFEVALLDIFKFLFPVTKAQAEAVSARIFERAGVRIETPPFYVNE